MTIAEILADIVRRKNQQGDIFTLEGALRQTAEEVLAGWRHMKTGELLLDEAREYAEFLRAEDRVFFTGYGYEVGAETLEAAITLAELWPNQQTYASA